MTKDKERTVRRSAAREYIEAIVFALILALIIKTFFIQAFKIPSGSMIPTLLKGDQILVNKFIYGTRIPLSDVKVLEVREPRRGDIVVFEYPEDRSIHYIKRLIGLPGDMIEVVNKVVFVNGKKLDVPQARYEDPEILPSAVSVRDNFGPEIVPPNCYFMMGDNRDNSRDSRFWGFVDYSELVGNAVIIYWSWDIESGNLFERLQERPLGETRHGAAQQIGAPMKKDAPFFVLISALAFVFLAFVLLFANVKMESTAMEPAIASGDYLLVWREAYGLRLPLAGEVVRLGRPARGDIVLIVKDREDDDGKDLRIAAVLRVVGLPGEVVSIADKHVWIDGQQLSEKLRTLHGRPRLPRGIVGPG